MVVVRRQIEQSVEDKVVEQALQRLGVLGLKFKPPGSNGWPDRIFLLPDRPFFIEFKRAGEPTRVLQDHRIEFLRGLGYEAEAYDTAEEALERLKTALRDRRRI